jgi:hypothetical protein
MQRLQTNLRGEVPLMSVYEGRQHIKQNAFE